MANRLSPEKVEEMWTVYREHESIREVARKCRVHHKTAARYRALERWDERLRTIRAQAQEHADYRLADALAESLALARRFEEKLSAGLDAKTFLPKHVTSAELDRIARLKAFLLGGSDSRMTVTFDGWSDEELERYAEDGILPDHASGS